jgi:hypothetical protein
MPSWSGTPHSLGVSHIILRERALYIWCHPTTSPSLRPHTKSTDFDVPLRWTPVGSPPPVPDVQFEQAWFRDIKHHRVDHDVSANRSVSVSDRIRRVVREVVV